MYASPRFTAASLSEIYEDEAFADLSFLKDWSYETWRRENRDRSYLTQRLKVQLIKTFLNEKERLLDVGCGIGLFCYEASREGFHAEGIDPSQRLIDAGRNALKVSVKQGLVEDFDPGYQYGGIVIWDVLEHVPNPVAILRKCHELLREGGFIFAQVPNYDGLSNRFKTFLCRRGLKRSDFKHFGFPWHIYAFNRISMGALLEAGGFHPLLCESWPHQMKERAQSPFQRFMISVAKRYCLTDYIVSVGQKRS
jgi:SAM-dependent methyltransferase